MSALTLPAMHEHPFDNQMVELPLLLPKWQAQAITDAAAAHGITAGQMLRRMIREYLGDDESDSSGF